jgi:hypothetical protein
LQNLLSKLRNRLLDLNIGIVFKSLATSLAYHS